MVVGSEIRDMKRKMSADVGLVALDRGFKMRAYVFLTRVSMDAGLRLTPSA